MNNKNQIRKNRILALTNLISQIQDLDAPREGASLIEVGVMPLFVNRSEELKDEDGEFMVWHEEQREDSDPDPLLQTNYPDKVAEFMYSIWEDDLKQQQDGTSHVPITIFWA